MRVRGPRRRYGSRQSTKGGREEGNESGVYSKGKRRGEGGESEAREEREEGRMRLDERGRRGK